MGDRLGTPGAVGFFYLLSSWPQKDEKEPKMDFLITTQNYVINSFLLMLLNDNVLCLLSFLEKHMSV